MSRTPTVHDFALHKSRTVTAGLMCYTIVLFPIAALGIGAYYGLTTVAWITLALGAVTLLYLAYRLIVPRIVVTFDAEGIVDHRSAIGCIPWASITRLEIVATSSHAYLNIEVADEESFLSDLPDWLARCHRGLTELGVSPLSIRLNGLGPHAGDLRAFLRTSRAEVLADVPTPAKRGVFPRLSVGELTPAGWLLAFATIGVTLLGAVVTVALVHNHVGTGRSVAVILAVPVVVVGVVFFFLVRMILNRLGVAVLRSDATGGRLEG